VQFERGRGRWERKTSIMHITPQIIACTSSRSKVKPTATEFGQRVILLENGNIFEEENEHKLSANRLPEEDVTFKLIFCMNLPPFMRQISGYECEVAKLAGGEILNVKISKERFP